MGYEWPYGSRLRKPGELWLRPRPAFAGQIVFTGPPAVHE